MLPPEETKVEELRPAWVSDELLEKTVRVWTRLMGKPISIADALEILRRTGSLIDAIKNAPGAPT